MLKAALLHEEGISSPAYIIDRTELEIRLQSLQALRGANGCKVLYSMKALPFQPVVELAADRLDGISVSSLYEARWMRELRGLNTGVHLTTPGIRPDEFDELKQLCTHISFNSISQWRAFANLGGSFSPGLRINPKYPVVSDQRFDPCRQFSKLGVDIDQLQQSGMPEGIEGLHLHSAFSCATPAPLIRTLNKILSMLPDILSRIHWLNLGGGYLFSRMNDQDKLRLIECIGHLKQNHGCEVYIEPGKDVVNSAGYLLATVVDCFDSGGKSVAILDSSVNHHPEIFEYQTAPQLWPQASGDVPVILAGSTCLAGDIFGEYRLQKLPEIGDRLVFRHCGAYSLVKANRFNGYNLPAVYQWDGGRLQRHKQYDYEDYRRLWRVDQPDRGAHQGTCRNAQA